MTALDRQPEQTSRGELPEASEQTSQGEFSEASEPTSQAEFLEAFDTLAQAIRRARGARAGSEQALTLSQFSLLQTLLDGRAARVRDLAEEAGISPSTATRILDALERRAVVRRARSTDDRRGVTVTLTESGHAAVAHQQQWLRARQRAFFTSLPDVERDLAPDLLIRLAALIDELAPGPEQFTAEPHTP